MTVEVCKNLEQEPLRLTCPEPVNLSRPFGATNHDYLSSSMSAISHGYEYSKTQRAVDKQTICLQVEGLINSVQGVYGGDRDGVLRTTIGMLQDVRTMVEGAQRDPISTKSILKLRNGLMGKVLKNI